MKIVFFGTPEFVVPVLSKLSKVHEIVAVVTQPPKPVGREQFKKYSPVDDWAHKKRVATFFDFKNLPEADLGICAAYGKIIPKNVINSFKFGILNIHPSLLPKYRGASPIPETIISGDTETGVTIIKMDEEMDHGPIVTFFKDDVLPGDTTQSLKERLFERSGDVLIQLIPAYTSGKVKPREQDESKVTFTKILTKEDGFINLNEKTPEEVERFVRALNPWPGVWTHIKLNKEEGQKRLKILEAHIEDEKLVLDKVQLEGKTEVSWKQFKEGYPQAII